jgi:hypothetical protein
MSPWLGTFGYAIASSVATSWFTSQHPITVAGMLYLSIGILITVLMVKGSAEGGPNLLALGVQRWDLKAISIYGEPKKFVTVHPSKPDGHQ